MKLHNTVQECQENEMNAVRIRIDIERQTHTHSTKYDNHEEYIKLNNMYASAKRIQKPKWRERCWMTAPSVTHQIENDERQPVCARMMSCWRCYCCCRMAYIIWHPISIRMDRYPWRIRIGVRERRGADSDVMLCDYVSCLTNESTNTLGYTIRSHPFAWNVV